VNSWFRFYNEVLNDPKVQQLSGDTFKAWVNLLCLASANDGVLPDVSAIAFALRLEEKRTQRVIDELINRNLLDCIEGRYAPHGWGSRQYKSDVSTDRVNRFRKRKRNVSSNVTGNVSSAVSRNVSSAVSETSPDTDTDSDLSYPGSEADLSGESLEPDPFPTGLERPPLGPISIAARGRR